MPLTVGQRVLDAMPLKAGQRVLGRFIVERSLRKGGMSFVFRGRHEKHGTPVALKVLPDGADAELVERFQREAELMAVASHPNLLTILDFARVEGLGHVIVMELVEGETLADRILRVGRLPLRDAVRLFHGVLDGLDALHTAGIIHRDLKPSNILIASGQPEVVKICDLGVARSDARYRRRVSQNGIVVGTPAFMAPEQITGGVVDERTDIFAVALMMREAITGEGTPHRATLRDMIRHLHDEVPPSTAPWLSPELSMVLTRAASPDPDRRPRDVQAFAAAIRSAMTGFAVEPFDSSPPASPPPPSNGVRYDGDTTVMRRRRKSTPEEAPTSRLRPLALPHRSPPSEEPADPQREGEPNDDANGAPPSGTTKRSKL